MYRSLNSVDNNCFRSKSTPKILLYLQSRVLSVSVWNYSKSNLGIEYEVGKEHRIRRIESLGMQATSQSMLETEGT